MLAKYNEDKPSALGVTHEEAAMKQNVFNTRVNI